MSELVTGEAVVLGLRPARLPSRALAVAIDLAMVFVAYLAVSMAMVAATASLDQAAGAAVSVATFVLVLVGVPIAVETLSRGRSLGKTVCGLRVVRDDGGPIRFRHALVRGAMGVVEILMTFGVVAVIASLVSARGRRVGDVFAGTLVVRERIPAPRGVRMPPPPPWLAGQFGRLDLSRVPDGLWLAVRQYLTRADQLDPDVRLHLARRLADDVAACTGTPVPVGVPPAIYLAGVAGERQARDAQRAFGGVNGAMRGEPTTTPNSAAWGTAPHVATGAAVPPIPPEPPAPFASHASSVTGSPNVTEAPSAGAVAPPETPEQSEPSAAESRPSTGFVPPV